MHAPDRLDFLVIGAQKCATSWLYYCLKEHPELHLSSHKREVEYLGGELYQQHGDDWYFGLLEGATDGQQVGDVSVEYMRDARSPSIVHSVAPEIKLIALLRHPIERAISAFYWNLRKGRFQNESLECGLLRALEALDGGSADNDEAIPYFLDILERGFYDNQLERYLNYFHPQQIFVALYEEVDRKPNEVIHRIYQHLGVEPTFQPASLRRRPKHNSYRSSLLWLERLSPRSRLLSAGVDRLHQLISVIAVPKGPPILSSALWEALVQLYLPHMRRTQLLIEKLPEKNRPLGMLSDLWKFERTSNE